MNFDIFFEALFISHALGGIHARCGYGRNCEYKPRCGGYSDVDKEYGGEIEFYRNTAQIIHLRVELQQSEMLLQPHQTQTKNIAYEHTYQCHSHGHAAEYAADKSPRRSEGAQYAYSRNSLKYNQKKARHKRKSGHAKHQREYYHHIGIEERQPVEIHRTFMQHRVDRVDILTASVVVIVEQNVVQAL